MTQHAEIQEKEKSWRTCPERPKDENKYNLCKLNQLLEQCLSARQTSRDTVSQYFFERTAQDSTCFIDIEEENTRL
jgi:hypothetical protein